MLPAAADRWIGLRLLLIDNDDSFTYNLVCRASLAPDANDAALGGLMPQPIGGEVRWRTA